MAIMLWLIFNKSNTENRQQLGEKDWKDAGGTEISVWETQKRHFPRSSVNNDELDWA